MKMRTCACVHRASGGGCVSQAPLQHAAAWEVAHAPVRVTTAKEPVWYRAAAALRPQTDTSAAAESSCTLGSPPPPPPPPSNTRTVNARRRALSRSVAPSHSGPPPPSLSLRTAYTHSQYAANRTERNYSDDRVIVRFNFVLFFGFSFFFLPSPLTTILRVCLPPLRRTRSFRALFSPWKNAVRDHNGAIVSPPKLGSGVND